MPKRKYVINHLDDEYRLTRVAGVAPDGTVQWCRIRHEEEDGPDERGQELRFDTQAEGEAWMQAHHLNDSRVFVVSVWAV